MCYDDNPMKCQCSRWARAETVEEMKANRHHARCPKGVIMGITQANKKAKANSQHFGTSLNVFTDGTETYAAKSLADLKVLLGEEGGEYLEDFRIVKDATMISIKEDLENSGPFPESFKVDPILEADRQFPEWTHLVTATAADWAAHCGRGLLCSTEY